MRLRSLSALGAFAVLAMLLVAMPASGAPDDAATKTYIVQMLQAPVVAYEGDVAGLEATKPAKGQKIDPNSASVKKYAEYLVGQHNAAIQKVGGAAKVYDFTYSLQRLRREAHRRAEGSAREAAERRSPSPRRRWSPRTRRRRLPSSG